MAPSQFEIAGTSREALNGQVVELLADADGGRFVCRLVAPPHTELKLRQEHLKDLSWGRTLASALGSLSGGELRTNARALWAKPACKVAVAVLAVAVFASRPGGRPAAAAAPERRRRPRYAVDAQAELAYALGYADAYRDRAHGSSLDGGGSDEDHADLVRETLADLPPETQGVRDEWLSRAGVGRQENVGRRTVHN